MEAVLDSQNHKSTGGYMKSRKTKRLVKRKDTARVREPKGIYKARKGKAAPSNPLLPGFDRSVPGEDHSASSSFIEAGFRRYGLEGEDVFLALAARCVQESRDHRNGFEFFPYERGLQVLDLVAHDRRIESLLARVCVGPDAVSHLPLWYQYFVGRRFREGSGKFFTPKPVARSMANLLPPDAGLTICDPTCGGGTFLSEVADLLNGRPCELVANDVDRTLVGLTEVVLFLTCGTSQKRRLFCDNIYDRGPFLDAYVGRVDCILANPPFSLPIDNVSVRSRLFEIGYRNSDAIFLDVCLELLKEGGHLVCVLPHSIVANAEFSELRSQVERDWELCGVITLPEGVFYMTASTTTRADIIHLRKKPTPKVSATLKVYFANAPTAGVALNSRDTTSTQNDLEDIVATIRARCFSFEVDA